MRPDTTPDLPFRLGRSGLEGGNGALIFLDSVLRGVGQVIFLDNSLTGLLCLIAIALHAPMQGAAGLAGAVLGTGLAIALRAERGEVRAGLYGYNGCLVAIALPQFLAGHAALWALTLAAAALSTPLLMLLRRGKALPALTAPFVLCSWGAIWLAAALASGAAEGARMVAVAPPGLLADWGMVEGALAGVAQIFLQPSALSGAVIALAILVASRRLFLLSVVAGLVASGTALLIGAPEAAVRAGLFGFNAVLAAMALGAVFLRPGPLSFAVALLTAALMPAVQTACALVLVPLGLPVMSLPFLLTTWAALLALRAVPQLRPAA